MFYGRTFNFCDVRIITNFAVDKARMKYFGSILDFTKERNEDLLRVYREQLARASYIVMPEIFALVADSPARRFWVSEERAAIVVSAMLAGKPLPKMRSNKREMFEEIYRRFLILRSEHPKKSVYELVTAVVNQPAPSSISLRALSESLFTE